jgi:hypothetical protein
MFPPAAGQQLAAVLGALQAVREVLRPQVLNRLRPDSQLRPSALRMSDRRNGHSKRDVRSRH